MGRPQTAPRQSWNKQEWITDEMHPQGVLADVTPAPGRTYTRDTWPPHGRGRGEALYSDRRMAAKLRAARVIRLRTDGLTFAQIARQVGFADGSGAYRAWKRTIDRLDWDTARRAELKRRQS